MEENENNKLNLVQLPSLIIDRVIAQIISPQLNSLNVKDLNETIGQLSNQVNDINHLKLIYSNFLNQLPHAQLERFRLLIGTLAFTRELTDERIQLSLNTLTHNKVRVDRLLCGGYVAKIDFKFEDKLLCDVSVIFDTKTSYGKQFTQLVDEEADHRVDIIWHSEPFSINGEQPYMSSNTTQTIFMSNVILCNMIAIHSKEFESILKSILASTFSFRAGLNTDYTNYLDRSIFTLPIATGSNIVVTSQAATANYGEYRKLIFYSRSSLWMKSNVSIYNPPVVWKMVSDPRFSPSITRTLSPNLRASRNNNVKVEYQLTALALQSDAAVHEILQSSSSVVNFAAISPIIDPIAKKWPWTIRTFEFIHGFTDPQDFEDAHPMLQQHIFSFAFTLE